MMCRKESRDHSSAATDIPGGPVQASPLENPEDDEVSSSVPPAVVQECVRRPPGFVEVYGPVGYSEGVIPAL